MPAQPACAANRSRQRACPDGRGVNCTWTACGCGGVTSSPAPGRAWTCCASTSRITGRSSPRPRSERPLPPATPWLPTWKPAGRRDSSAARATTPSSRSAAPAAPPPPCVWVPPHLETRWKAGFISGPRDNALITLGRAYAQINAAMLAALTAQRLSQAGDERAELWGCAAKAHGVDVAYTAASELALLAGAPGFAADSPLARASV